MTSAAAVLVCVLDLLGRSAGSLPPIALIESPPVGVSARAEGFITRNPDRIYLVTSTPVFLDAMHAELPGRDITPLRKLASIIVHEEWHLRHGPDEGGAYAAQLTALQMLGAGQESVVYGMVKRSMLAVLSAEKKRLLAARAQPGVLEGTMTRRISRD